MIRERCLAFFWLLLCACAPFAAFSEELPSLELRTAGLRVAPGGSASFNVVVPDFYPKTPVASVTNTFWLFNGALAVGETNAYLTITNVQTTNAGLYAYVVETSSGCVTSAPASLSVELQPPQPQSYTITFGPRFQLIANHFNYGDYNSLNSFLPYSDYNGPSLVGVLGVKYLDGDRRFILTYLDEIDKLWYPLYPPSIYLHPGQGLILFHNSQEAGTKTVTGIPHIPILPVSIGPRPRLLACQTNTIGTFENIVGTPPRNGAVVYRLKPGAYPFDLVASNYWIYTFENDRWNPEPPSVPIGEAVWIAQRPTLSNLHFGTNGLVFSFPTSIRQTNYLESTTNLQSSHWDVLQTFVGNGQTMTISTGQSPTNAPHRFYRVNAPEDLPYRFQ